jgi:23S rRNA (pseudouridine1915-N3)-methyltransferase
VKIKIISIGKIKSKPVTELVSDYFSRLKHYHNASLNSFRDDFYALGEISSSDYLVVMDEHGKKLSSVGLAEFIESRANASTKNLCFFIGGPDGVSDEVKFRANLILSLSDMTFPHELAQAMLLEQLYRASSINRNEPYHRT